MPSSPQPTPFDRPAPAAGSNFPLVLDLVEWVAREPRTYGEVMEAWRTSCPRLTIWEDAVEAGFVERKTVLCGSMVIVTARGRELLVAAGRWLSGSVQAATAE